jgi:hypothetical protein
MTIAVRIIVIAVSAVYFASSIYLLRKWSR